MSRGGKIRSAPKPGAAKRGSRKKPKAPGKGRAAAGRAARRPSAPTAPEAGGAAAAREGTVVLGIIDDAICFAQERFRLGEGTRVEFAWLQDGAYPGPGTPAYRGSPPVDYGIEHCKHPQGAYPGIDGMLAASTHAGVVDEDEVYRRAGLIDFRRAGHKAAAWRIAHGTHVADIACGEDPASKCETRPIVCVQLPAMTTADTSGADLHTYALDAVEYILLRADAIARARGTGPLPVAINFSYGMIGGPHDGTSELEKALDALVQWRRAVVKAPLEIVLPAGNSHLSRCHARVAFARKGEEVELHWRILPDDRTPSYLEAWLPCGPAVAESAARVALEIVTPGGAVVGSEIAEGAAGSFEWQSAQGPVCSVRYIWVPQDTNRGMFFVTVAPTFSDDPAVATAPAGNWTVRLKNRALARNESVQLWVRRDDTLYGHPRRGRQSHFVDAAYRRFDPAGREEERDHDASRIERAGLLNAIGTGGETVVVGALLGQEMVAAKYSAGGPVSIACAERAPTRGGPDALAVGDDSRVKFGVLAAGSRSGSVVAMNGTSVSAPRITRWIAERLAQGTPAGWTGRAAVASLAAAQEASPPPRPAVRPPLPNARYGAGRVVLPPRTRVPRDA